MLDPVDQTGGGDIADGQAVVEAQRVGDVEGRDITLFLTDIGVAGRRQLHEFVRTALNERLTDIVADATAVLGRDQQRLDRVKLRLVFIRLGVEQVGVGAQIAEIGLLGADIATRAVQENLGLTVDLAIEAVDEVTDIVDDRDQILVGELFDVLDALQIGAVQGVDAVDVGREGVAAVQHLGDVAVLVEADNQLADIAVVGAGVDVEDRALAGELLRIGLQKLAVVLLGLVLTQRRHVGAVRHDLVRTTADEHVDRAALLGQRLGQGLLDRRFLQVRHENDLLDALGLQLFDRRGDVGDQRLDLLIDRRARGDVTGEHLDIAGIGDRGQERRDRTDDADRMAIDLGDDRAGQGRRDRLAGIVDDLEGLRQLGIAVVEIVGQVRIGRALEAILADANAHDLFVRGDGVEEGLVAVVELVVADRRDLDTQEVVDQSVGDERLIVEIGAGIAERAGDVQVARGNLQHVAVNVTVLAAAIERLHHGRRGDGVLQGRHTGFLVRQMQELEREFFVHNPSLPCRK